MTRAEIIDRLAHLFATRGAGQYGGEPVSQSDHALQAALAAEQAGEPPDLIAAALLHDVGHLLHGHGEDCADRGIDDRHEELGVRFLRRAFGPGVTEPVRLHVPAKRYLTAVDPGYAARLSPASVQSLALQGGPMSAGECAGFEALPHAGAAVRLRRYDDQAKDPDLRPPGFDHFRRYLELAG